MTPSLRSVRTKSTKGFQWLLRTSILHLSHSSHAAVLRRRRYSTIISSRTENVEVRTRSNGQITLNIHHAYDGRPTSPIIIYLPNGPSDLEPRPEDRDILSQLAALAPQSTIVKINFRFNSPYEFPTPIHDVVAGYDWARENLVNSSSKTISSPVQQQQHIGVCGGLLGGGLAAMLALTECQKMGTSITSTYLSSPVLDWSFPGSVPVSTPSKTGTFKASKVSKATAPASSWDRISPSQALRPSDLLSARTALFRKLENTLDPFASPLLFLRTPLVSYNEEEAEDDAAEQETQHEKEREGRLHETQSVLRIARVPLHHRHHPPAHSGLQIPRVHIAVDPDSILYDQAWEFARLLRRSVMNSERGAGQRYLDDQREGQIDGKGGNDAVTEEARIEAEKRISFDEVGIEDAVKSMGKWAAGLSE